ncbi:hydroxyacylglutathione hydrolase [Shewanella inventionis]|uniref:Hydroxyacylglutathione hydrolase n=1 Tax=Shewanella inventionis TaxID=1738770 RepID=A0ABQ1IS33_9GAMM|nr:hydroxyacylglutathione hydrolase [Shewanella inventionis]MCL1157206.1 hydroxyacylglutathione hydrolase [Shewanella inventionis]UAL41936.1 hydroxyacylglutathione hydrolase [Shewanella inventionis]GGB49034.1 hydroxyacylglutathione hydrolase [Shewanella inventionis]
MFKVHTIAAFKDNYIWLIHQIGSSKAYVVDPGCAQSVIDYLATTTLNLVGVLITHHHSDHTGGIAQLQQHFDHRLVVYGPSNEQIAGLTESLSININTTIDISHLGNVQVFAVPGHTLGHIAYYIDNKLFCGDTLFSGGCGRLFEGTPNQMLQSLKMLAQLPDNTEVYCAHEYTRANLNFAQQVTPNNIELNKYSQKVDQLRSQNIPSIPSTIAIEKAINPFLRCHINETQVAISNEYKIPNIDEIQTFTLMREWKNNF